MADSYFAHISGSGGALTDGGRLLLTDGSARFSSGPATAGPWAPHLQHGGPPNALAVAVAEQHVHDTTGRADLVAVRLAADFLGPVPVGDLDVGARVLRAARSAALVEVIVTAGGRECLHTRVWFVRDADTTAVASADAAGPLTVPDHGAGIDADFPYGDSIEWRFVSGAMRTPGPATVWARPRMALVGRHLMSGLSRAALVGDSGNGVSALLDWTQWSFMNVDLDIHLARPVAGDWLLLDAETRLGPHGSGLARSTLSDERGPVGAGSQTLVVAPIRH